MEEPPKFTIGKQSEIKLSTAAAIIATTTSTRR